MRSSLFAPLVVLSSLSTLLAIAILACSAQALRIFNQDQSSDIWLLPLWREHFDTRDIQTFVGAGVVITLFSIIILVSTLVAKTPTTILNLVLSSLSAVAALVALILSNVIDRQAPQKDTLQTWTCSWINDNDAVQQGLSSDFTSTCRATRTAFYGIIPLFLLQLALIACAALVPVVRKRSIYAHGDAVEKGHSLDAYERQPSWDSRGSIKTGPVESVQPVQRA